MLIEETFNLGYVNKAHGINGELIIRTDLNFSKKTLKNWESIFFRIEGILVPFFIESIQERANAGILIKIEDVDNEIQAKKYVGTSVYLDKKFQCIEEIGMSKFISYKVFDTEENALGEIIDIIEYPSQTIFLIDTIDHTEVEIPAIEEWIISIQDDSKIIILDLPEGLLEINNSDEFI